MLAGKLPYRDFALNAGPLARLVERLWSRRRAWGGVLAVAAALCVGFNCLTNGNLPYIGYPAEELPQQKFAQIMAENGGGSMLTLEIPDCGFYLAAGALPENARFADCPAWFVSSVASEGLKSQYDVLEHNGVEWVILRRGRHVQWILHVGRRGQLALRPQRRCAGEFLPLLSVPQGAVKR